MPISDCPNCGDRMRVDSDDLGERVVCPSCNHRFIPRDDDGGERLPRLRGRDDFDRPPKKSNALLYVVLALLTLFVGLPCLGCVGWFVYFNSATADFSAAWSDHSVADANGGPAPVTASFPSPPVSNLLTDPANSGFGQTLSVDNIQQNGAFTDATLLVGYLDYADGIANPLEVAYLPIRTAIADLHLNNNPLMKPTVASETSATVGGYPAKEARYAKDSGDYTLRVIHVNDRPKDGPVRLVVVLAGGTGLKEADKQKFMNSVKIGKGK